MRQLNSTRKFIALIALFLMLAAAAPATSFAKDRQGKWRNRGDWSKRDRKCGKFVNCHDARDGRWDGRGARGNRVGNIVWRNRNRRDDNNFRYRRYRNVNNNRLWLRARHR